MRANPGGLAVGWLLAAIMNEILSGCEIRSTGIRPEGRFARPAFLFLSHLSCRVPGAAQGLLLPARRAQASWAVNVIVIGLGRPPRQALTFDRRLHHPICE